MSQENEQVSVQQGSVVLLLQQLLSHRFARIQASIWKVLLSQFLSGIAFGLGSVLGATIVVYLVVMALGLLEVIPFVGDLASQIIAEINSAKTASER